MLSEQEEQAEYEEWKALATSEKMRVDIAMASTYADEVAKLEEALKDVIADVEALAPAFKFHMPASIKKAREALAGESDE